MHSTLPFAPYAVYTVLSSMGLQVLVGGASWFLNPPFSLLVQEIVYHEPDFIDSEIKHEVEKIAAFCATKCIEEHVNAQYRHRVAQKHS